MVERSDAALLVAMKDDPNAMALFYRRYLRAVAGYFVARTRNPGLAADLTAETFAAALGASHRCRPGCSITNWLYLLARVVLIESLRGGRVDDRRRRALGISPTPLAPGDIERVQRIWQSQQDGSLELLEGLPARVREVLSAPIAAGPQRMIGFELAQSDWAVCDWIDGGRTPGRVACADGLEREFFDQIERKLVDAAARGAHLPWHRRVRRWGGPAGHITDASGTP